MSNRSLQAATRLALVVLACLGLGVPHAAAQAPPATATWVDQFGDLPSAEPAQSVVVAGQSVYVAGPSTANGGVINPSYLRRYSKEGTLIWELPLVTGTATPPTLLAEGSRVCVGGTTRLDLDGGAPPLDQSAGFIRCLDPEGVTLWSDEIHATRDLFAPATTVAAIAASGDALYVVGSTSGAVAGCAPECENAGLTDAFIRKYSFDGTTLSPEWTRQYGTEGNDYFQGLSVDASGERVRVWGTEQVSLGGGPPWSANTLRLGCYYEDGSECGTSERALGSEAPAAGTYVGDAFYLARYVADPGAGWGFATGIQRFTLIDGIVILDPDWSDSLPNAVAYDMTADGSGVVLAGLAQVPLPGQVGAGGQDALARRYDEAGAATWTVQFGTRTSDIAFGVALDSDSLYLAGQTSGALVDGFPPTGNIDGFVARIERPDSPESAIGGLIVRVTELVDVGTLKNGQGRSLIGKLQLALMALDVGNTKKAVTMLEAFVHQIRAFKNAGVLAPELADELIAIAEGAIASILP